MDKKCREQLLDQRGQSGEMDREDKEGARLKEENTFFKQHKRKIGEKLNEDEK